MKEKFQNNYLRYIRPEDKLVVGVSGGVDSMVLLHLLSSIHPRENLIIAHVDHELRGRESDGDRELVRTTCRKWRITYEESRIDVLSISKQKKKSVETAAREARYEFFHVVYERYGARYILTAHHLDDRIETMMFHLLRGTKLGGIHALRESENRILRLFFEVTKAEIRQYADMEGVLYREDATNTETTYLRNHLRHKVLENFTIVNPEYRHALSHFMAYSEDMMHYLDGEVEKWLSRYEIGTFSSQDFIVLTPFFQKEVIRYLYEKANSGTQGLSEGNIDELARYICDGHGNTVKSLHGLRLQKKNHIISYIFQASTNGQGD